MVIDEFKNLSPEERIRKLKLLEEKRKKEIEEAQKMIKESENQIDQERKLKERMPIPQLTAVDVDSLFGEPEAEMFRAKQFVDVKKKEEEAPPVEALEEAVADAPVHKMSEEQARAAEHEYISQLAMKPAGEITGEIYNIGKSMEDGSANEMQGQRLYQLNRALEEKEEAIKSGEYNPSEYVKREIDLGDRLSKQLMGDYQR